MQLNKRGLMATLMMTTLVLSPLAEAKRVGSGKSYGMSRTTSSSSTSSTTGSQTSQPTQTTNSYPTQQTQPAGSGVGKMVAAGVAGAAIGAVAANAMANDDPTQSTDPTTSTDATKPEEKNNFSWLWILALAAGAFFLFRRFAAKKATANNNPFAPNNSSSQRNVPPTAPFARSNTTPSANGDNTNIFGQTVGGSAIGAGAAYINNGNQLPDGTQPAAFLRQARAKFLHLQSMNSSSNIEEVRRYFTPEMYLAIRDDILSNNDLAEFPQLNAQLADSSTENGQYVASVRFSGLVSESLNADAVPFTETWHFVKANGGEWLVAGIQQG